MKIKTERLDNLTDEELVKRCKTELPFVSTSFEVLVNRYKDSIFAKALGMLRHPQDAEDVTQEIFLKVYDALPKFEMRASFKTWIYIIAANTCLTYIDRRKRKRWWWLTEDLDEIHKSEKEDKSLFMAVGLGLEREELRDGIDRAMEKLSEAHREVLKLRYYEELDYESIAGKLRIKLSAAKMRLKRAREEFKNHYQHIEEI